MARIIIETDSINDMKIIAGILNSDMHDFVYDSSYIETENGPNWIHLEESKTAYQEITFLAKRKTQPKES